MVYSGEPGKHQRLIYPSFCFLPSKGVLTHSNTGDTVQFTEYVERNIRVISNPCVQAQPRPGCIVLSLNPSVRGILIW